jgi:L-ribulose-5-phosphate 3-epimerase
MAEQWSRRKFCLALGTLSAGARLSRAEAGMESLPFKLGVITDEIAEDLGQALDFKDTENLLREVFKLARFFGTSKVRVFSYWRVKEPEEAFPHVRESLAKAAALAAQNKITLLLENEHECNVGTGKELGRMLREINSPYLRGMWDPCNAARLGEVPYPDGYRQVRGLFRHMHIKDIKKDPTTGELQRVPVGKGMIDFRGQFKALRDDGYDGTMSLETGYSRPDGSKVESTRECLEGLFRILKSVDAKKSEVRSQKSEGLPRL